MKTLLARRDFLKFSVAASGGLLIGFYVPDVIGQAMPGSHEAGFMPNAIVSGA